MHETRKRYRRHHEPSGRKFEVRLARHGGGWFGPTPWSGRRARRGDVRAALLALLAERPMHGYDIIQELASRSGGAWRPSPGSIYPTLQMLEDEELVTSEERDGKRVFSLTDPGKAEVEARKERSGGVPPWEFGQGGEGVVQLREAFFQLGAAAMQVARAGSSAQMKQAAEIVSEARKKIYALLAEA